MPKKYETYQESIDALTKIIVDKDKSLSSDEQLNKALKLALEFLDYRVAIISKIEGADYFVRSFQSYKSDIDIEIGTKFDLEGTYCSIMLKKENLFYVDHMKESEFNKHPCYSSFGLESYMGVPLFVNGKRYGTLNFSSPDKRETQTNENMIKFVELLGNWVENKLYYMELSEKRREEFGNLEEQKLLFESIIENSPNILVYANENREIQYVNQKFTDVFGYKLEEIKNKKTLILYANADDFHNKTSKRFNKNAVADSNSYLIEYKKKNNEVFKGETVGSVIRNESKEVIGFLGIINDVTEKLEMQKQIDLEKSKNVQASKLASLGEMAAGVAHEINNPLAIIGLNTFILEKMIKKDQIDKPTMQEKLAAIKTNVDRAGKIVKGLKTFSRDASKDDMQEFDVTTLISDIKDMTAEKYKNYNIDFKINYNGDHKIKGRSIQLTQVLINLLNNAFDEIKGLKEAKFIHMNINVDNEFVYFNITDSGELIDKNITDKIFDPFFTTKEVGQGTGLGLSISKGIANDHDGDLYYEVQNNQNTFIFKVPLVS